MTVPLSEVFFPSVVVCNINQVRKSFFEELGIYDNETFIRQIYYDYIEGGSKKMGNHEEDNQKIAVHEKIMNEYLAKNNKSSEADQSINWITHQKCKDMFILSKVSLLHFVAFFHVASLFSTGVDNEKALELTNSTVFHRGRQ